VGESRVYCKLCGQNAGFLTLNLVYNLHLSQQQNSINFLGLADTSDGSTANTENRDVKPDGS
jgi:hypothetical protein